MTRRPISEFSQERRQIVQALGALAVTSVLGGCAKSTDVGATTAGASPIGTTANNPQPNAPGALISTAVAVGTTALGTVPNGFIGLSFEKGDLSEQILSTTNTGLVALCALLGKSTLRIGGNSVDRYIFVPNGPGQTFLQFSDSDINTFAAFVSAIGWNVIYGINLLDSATNYGTQTQALASAEAVYVAGKLGASLAYLEIGNEPDDYQAASGGTYTYAQYKALWEPLATAVLQAEPTLSLSGPALANQSNVPTWTTPFSSDEKSRNLALLTQHYYLAADGTPATLLASLNSTTITMLSELQSLSLSTGLPWRMSEFGTFYGNTNTDAKEFASALFILNFLFTLVQYGCAGGNLHTGGTADFAPTNDDSNHTETGINAVFYAALLFSMGGAGTSVITAISSAVPGNAHTIQVDSKHYSTYILNYDQTASQSMNVSLTLPSAVASATLRILTAPSLSAVTGTTLQGASVGVSGSYNPAEDYTLTVSGSTVSCNVPYNSAVLVKSVLN